MASKMTTKDFFASGTPNQFEFALTLYDKALRLKAESKSQKPENVIKLDKWYQNELPKKIKSRGKDAHLLHDELVQTIKWKLARGKFRPNLVNLVQMNTPRVVQQETKKAFRNLQKKNDLQSASNALCNLKGVGPGLASAVLAAGAPHIAPFMADECLLAMPDVDSLDYTMKEYMRYVEYVKGCVERLNTHSGDSSWTPHRVELAVWVHYILRDLKPDLLVDMPEAAEAAKAAPAAAPAEEATTKNGTEAVDEDTKSSMTSSVGDEDSNSVSEPSAKNHTEAETPTTTEATDKSEEEETTLPPSSANESEVVAKNGNKETDKEEEAEDKTPKTNGNGSTHSNGSADAAAEPSVASSDSDNIAKEHQNGDNNEESKAKAASEQPQPNGELENGVKSSEKESTDLRSSSPQNSQKRNSDQISESAKDDAASNTTEVDSEQPAAKKLKTCEDPTPATAEDSGAAPAPAAPTAAAPVAV